MKTNCSIFLFFEVYLEFFAVSKNFKLLCIHSISRKAPKMFCGTLLLEALSQTLHKLVSISNVPDFEPRRSYIIPQTELKSDSRTGLVLSLLCHFPIFQAEDDSGAHSD